MRRFRKNPDSLIQKAMEGAYRRGRPPEEEIEIEETSTELTSDEEMIANLITAYRASEDDPEAQRAIMKRIKQFATRNNPSCQCSHYRRNPDEDIRALERALTQNPDDHQLRQQMLLAKIRAGRLEPGNVLFRLAGFLGDPDVRTITKELGVKESWGILAPQHKFPKLLVKRLLEGAENIPIVKQDARTEVIAGITALLLPFEIIGSQPSWVPRYKAILLKELLPRKDAELSFGSRAFGKKWTPLVAIVDSLFPDGTGHPTPARIPQPQDTPLAGILWSLRNINNEAPHQRNLWLSYLEGASDNLIDTARDDIYKYWKPILDRILYSWNYTLLNDISLYPYLT